MKGEETPFHIAYDFSPAQEGLNNLQRQGRDAERFAAAARAESESVRQQLNDLATDLRQCSSEQTAARQEVGCAQRLLHTHRSSDSGRIIAEVRSFQDRIASWLRRWRI
jgi:hypothetical protein